jgi:hypothetical protein
MSVISDFSKINKMTDLQNFRNGTKQPYFDETTTVRPIATDHINFEPDYI